MALLAVLAYCKLDIGPDQVVAIEVVLPDSGRIEVTDTLHPRARALNGRGDSVGAEIFWASLDTANLEVLDSTTGLALAKVVGPGRLQARAGALRSNPQSLTILARLDSLRAGGPTRDTVFVGADSLSDSLRIEAFASGGAPSNRSVVYTATTFPASGPAVTFVPKDVVLTNAAGLAAARLRFLSGTLADSVSVTATLRRPDGTPIPGSPVTFVVEFRP